MFKFTTITLLIITIIYLSIRLFFGIQLYQILLKASSSSGLVRMTQADNDYGMVLKPNSITTNFRPDSMEIVIKTDNYGFRTSGLSSTKIKTDIVALGCSFMFAENVSAENTFVNQFATNYNAAVLDMSAGGYGFSQMLMR